MKSHSYKSLPHPVLYSGESKPQERDYQFKEFRVTQELTDLKDGSLLLEFAYALNESSLLTQIVKGNAVYASRISCTATFFRKLVFCNEPALKIILSKDDLHSKVTASSFVVCTRDVIGHYSESFHPKFKDERFDLAQGDVLAYADFQKPIWQAS